MSLQLRDLVVTGPSGPIVTRMDLSVQPGQTVALVGESGSGKSMTAKAMTGLLPRGVTAAGTLALGDTMVFPPEGEWWGEFAPGAYTGQVLTMQQTPWFKQDLFGLATAHCW